MRPTKTIEQCINKDFSVDKIKTSEYKESWDFAVIDQWKDLIAWYYSWNKQIYNWELPTIIYWDHTNIVKYIDFPFICWADWVKVLTPKKDIYAKYFYYVLNCVKPETQWYRRHYPLLKNIHIPLPPLETQKTIVAKLDQMFAELDQTKSEIQKNLDNTDELWKSALNQTFQGDWEMKKLGEMAEIQNWWTPKTEKKEYWDWDILWITPKDMWELNSRYIDDTSRKISNLWLSNSSAKLLPIKSVILSSRAPIWYVAINTKPISTNQGCKWIIPNDNLKAEYLYYFLILSNKLLNSLGSGATFKELSSSKLWVVEIPVPPLSEQEKIVEHLDQVLKEVKALKSQYQSQLDNLEELKKSMLDKAFRWEIGE